MEEPFSRSSEGRKIDATTELPRLGEHRSAAKHELGDQSGRSIPSKLAEPKNSEATDVHHQPLQYHTSDTRGKRQLAAYQSCQGLPTATQRSREEARVERSNASKERGPSDLQQEYATPTQYRGYDKCGKPWGIPTAPFETWHQVTQAIREREAATHERRPKKGHHVGQTIRNHRKATNGETPSVQGAKPHNELRNTSTKQLHKARHPCVDQTTKYPYQPAKRWYEWFGQHPKLPPCPKSLPKGRVLPRPCRARSDVGPRQCHPHEAMQELQKPEQWTMDIADSP